MHVFPAILTILVTLSLGVTAAPAEAAGVERALPGLPKLGAVGEMPASLLGKFAVAPQAAPVSSGGGDGGGAPSADWGFAGNSAGWNWKREPEPKKSKKVHGHKAKHAAHKTKEPAHQHKAAAAAPAGDWGFTGGGPGANWKRTDGQQAKMERVVKRVVVG